MAHTLPYAASRPVRPLVTSIPKHIAACAATSTRQQHTVAGGTRPQLVRASSTAAVGVVTAANSAATSAAPTANARLSAMSALPTGALLRSLLVAFVSSHRLLLLPTLSVLSFLSKPNRSFIFNPDKNPVLHALLKKGFYEQFCTGENTAETRACVGRLKEMGFKGVILTYGRETVYDKNGNTIHEAPVEALSKEARTDVEDPQIEAWRVGVMKTADQIEEGDLLAIKYVLQHVLVDILWKRDADITTRLTGAGKAVNQALIKNIPPPPQMLETLDEICAAIKAKKARLIVDAEAQHVQHGIDNVVLGLMRKFNREGTAVVYNTYQAYLKGAPALVSRHLAAAAEDGFTMGLKVVRGAYINSEERSLIHDTKEGTDQCYDSLVLGAIRREIGEFGKEGGRPFPSVDLLVCGHNKRSVFSANRLRQERLAAGLPTVSTGFGQLQGMSDALGFQLLQGKSASQAAPDVYKCSTWGTVGECLAYLTRRAVENRDAVSRTEDEYAALRSELRRRILG